MLSDLLVGDTLYYADKESKRDAATLTTDKEHSMISAQVSFSMPKWTKNCDITSLDGVNVSSLTIAPESQTLLVGDKSGSIHAILPSSLTRGRLSSSKRTIIKMNSAGDSEDDSPGHYSNVTGLSTKPPMKTMVALVYRKVLHVVPMGWYYLAVSL